MWPITEETRRLLKIRQNGEVFVSRFVSVQKLIDYLWLRKSGSKVSIAIYCWHVYRFCRWAKIGPDDVLAMSRKELEEIVQHYLDDVRRQGMHRGPSVRTVNATLGCLKTFFRVNGFNRESNQDLRLQSYHQPPRTRNRDQYVPTLNEMNRMADRSGNWRNRTIVLTSSSTGLRNAALRAIHVKDIIKELEAGYENLLIKVDPEWNKRIPGACKNNIPYYTFTSPPATRAIKEMLKERKEKFGFVEEDEPLFISQGCQLRKKLPLSSREELEIVKKTAKQAGIEKWKHVTPHSLRKVFESILRSLMEDGSRLDLKDQEFLMGHLLPGTQDAYYDWTKIDRLRKEYSKLVFEERNSPELQNLNIYREMAKILGIDPDEVKSNRQGELDRQLTLKEEKETLETCIKSKLACLHENRGEQRIICKEELQTFLDEGWRFLSILDQQSIIVEKPLSTVDFALNPSSNGETPKREEHM